MPNQGEAMMNGGFYQTVIELLACSILIWKDVEGSSKFQVQGSKNLDILFTQQCGRWNGYRLVAGREHGPAVRTTLCQEQWLARFEQIEYWQIVYGALGSSWKTEPWGSPFDEVPVLNPYQMTLAVVIGYL